MRSLNIGFDFIFTGPSEKRLRVLKSQEVLQKMHHKLLTFLLMK